MKKGKKGSSGKWSDRVVCVVSMLPDEEGKQLKQQVQRITTNESIVLLSREKQPKQQVQRITTISISHAQNRARSSFAMRERITGERSCKSL